MIESDFIKIYYWCCNSPNRCQHALELKKIDILDNDNKICPECGYSLIMIPDKGFIITDSQYFQFMNGFLIIYIILCLFGIYLYYLL